MWTQKSICLCGWFVIVFLSKSVCDIEHQYGRFCRNPLFVKYSVMSVKWVMFCVAVEHSRYFIYFCKKCVCISCLPIPAECLANQSLFDIIFGEEDCKLWSFSMCNFFHPLVFSSTLDLLLCAFSLGWGLITQTNTECPKTFYTVENRTNTHIYISSQIVGNPVL